MSATATGYLASKPRYEILDGLRGVAAMIVVRRLILTRSEILAPRATIPNRRL